MAGDRQGIPIRVRQAALQRGALLGLPRGLPLRSGPVRLFIIRSYPMPRHEARTACAPVVARPGPASLIAPSAYTLA